MVSLVQSSPSAVVNASSGAAIAENTNPSAVVGQLRLTPQAVDDIVAQAAIIAKADIIVQQQHALASMGFNDDDDIQDMLDLAAEAQAQGVALTTYPTLKRIADEMASRLHAFTIINKHKQDANPALFAEVSRGLKQETLQAALNELDLLAANLGYEPEDEPVLVDKAVREKDNIDLDSGLLAYYPFEGDARNHAHDAYHGNVYGGATLVDGVVGKAYKFDGIDDYIEIDSNGYLEPSELTVAFWTRFRPNGLAPVVIGCSSWIDSNRHGWTFEHRQSDHKSYFVYGPGNSHEWNGVGYGTYGNSDKQYNFADNQWRYFVITLDDFHVRMNVNGSLLGENSAYSLPLARSNDSVRIGSSHYNPSLFLNGIVDEVRIYNRALNAQEAEALYQRDIQAASVTPSPSPAASPSTPASASPDGNIHIEIDRNVFLIAMAAFAGMSAGALGVLCICACKQRQDAVHNSHQQLVDEDTPHVVAVGVAQSSVSQAPHAVLFQSAPVNHNQRQTKHTDKAWNSCSML